MWFEGARSERDSDTTWMRASGANEIGFQLVTGEECVQNCVPVAHGEEECKCESGLFQQGMWAGGGQVGGLWSAWRAGLCSDEGDDASRYLCWETG